MTDEMKEEKYGTPLIGESDPGEPMSNRSATATLERPTAETQRPMALFSANETNQFRSRWNDIQAKFIDEPRYSMEEADALVADVINRLSQVFTDERAKLNQHWEKEEMVPTEDLRLTVLRYRSLFDRLLSL